MTPILTNIDSKAKIFLAQSPIHFNFQNEALDASIQKVTVEVYLWRGSQLADLPTTPSIVFNNIPKISPDDNYIAIEIHNEVRAFITSSNLNKNNPQWAYNTTTKATTAGEGVYFHIVYKVDSESVVTLMEPADFIFSNSEPIYFSPQCLINGTFISILDKSISEELSSSSSSAPKMLFKSSVSIISPSSLKTDT